MTEAMAHPRELDQDLIDAYLARRALDYLFGFTLSPVLWRKLPGAKSAGRVQSVALRLIVEREREIEAFGPQEYWSVVAQMEHDGTAFDARLVTFDGQKLERLEHRRCRHAPSGPRRRSRPGASRSRRSRPSRSSAIPAPPFTTSTLQQEAARKLGFSASHTMRRGAVRSTRRARSPTCGPTACRWTAARSRAARQRDRRPLRRALPAREAAHLRDQGQERAGSARGDPPDRLHRDRYGSRATRRRLYDLICKRAMASQMASASLERTTVTLRDPTGQTRAARHRTGREVSRLPRGLRGRARPEVERGGRGQACCPCMRAGRCPGQARRRRRPSTSPSRRRAIPKRAWSSGSRNSASAGLRPMPRPSRCCKDRDYVRIEKNRFFAEEFGPTADRVPRTLLRALRRLRLHRRDGGRARRRLRRARRSGRPCSRRSGATSSPRATR